MNVVEIAFTAYPVTDLKRAKGFYEGTLSLKQARAFGDDQTAWVEYDIGPGTLAISNFAPEWKPSPGGGSVGLEVDDFDGALAQLKASGAPILNGPMDTPVCRMAVVADPDGNAVTIHQRKA